MGRRRKKRREEEESLERWLVSYADFVTLLFAFFVVMYAISSVNEGKYRVLSESLNAVFQESVRSIEPAQVGEEVRELVPSQGDFPAGAVQDIKPESAADIEGQASATRLSDQIELSLEEYIDKELVSIKRNGDNIEIEIKAKLLFESGQARLSRVALSVLKELAGKLLGLPNRLQIEGHTDDVPISSIAFPSNWELSAARAASVVHYLARQGIAPERLSAVGYGEYRPLASNGTAQDRSRNRRVILVIEGAPVTPGEPALDGDVPWAEAPALSPL